MAVINKVLSGEATIGSTSVVSQVTIESIVTEKSFLIFGATPGSNNPETGFVTGQIIDQTTIEFRRIGAIGEVTINWYIVEGLTGISVQRGTVTNLGTSLTLAISAIDLTKSFAIGTLRITGTTTASDDFVRFELPTSTSLTLNRVGSGTVHAVEWQVVQYDDCVVSSGTVSFLSTESTKTASVSISNINKAFLLFSTSSASGNGNNAIQKLFRGRITDNTTLTFDRSGTGQAVTLHYFLGEFTDETKTQSRSYFFTDTDPETMDITLTTPVDVTRSIVFTSGTYHRYGRHSYTVDDNTTMSSHRLSFVNSTTVRSHRDLTGITGITNAQTALQVWEFPAGSTGTTYINLTAFSTGVSEAIATSQALINSIASSTGSSEHQSAAKIIFNSIAYSEGLSSYQSTLKTAISLFASSRGFSSDYGYLSLTTNNTAFSRGSSEAIATPKIFYSLSGFSTGIGSVNLSISTANYVELSAFSGGASSYSISPSVVISTSGFSIGFSRTIALPKVAYNLTGYSQGSSIATSTSSLTISSSGVSAGSSGAIAMPSSVLSLSGFSTGVSGYLNRANYAIDLTGFSIGSSEYVTDLEKIILNVFSTFPLYFDAAIEPLPILDCAIEHYPLLATEIESIPKVESSIESIAV